MADTEDRIRAGTRLLRKGGDPLHVRIRELARQKGVDLDTSLVVSFMPEGRTYCSVVLVTERGQVYELEVSYADKGEVSDPELRYRRAQLQAWRDFTDSFGRRAFGGEVATALQMLRSAQPV